MNKQTLCKKFKGGFSYGTSYETVELLLDRKHTKADELHLLAYDADLIGLSKASTWSKKAQGQLKQAVCENTKDYPITVYVDDLLIKRKKG